MAKVRTIRTLDKRQKLLVAIAEGFTISEAAKCAGMGLRSVYDWKTADPAFARDYELAYEAGTDKYEAIARERAFAGNDVLLLFLLKQRDPKRFNQKMVTIGGDPNHPVGVQHSGEIGSNVIFYLPHNFRDQPEELVHAAPALEAKAEPDDEDAA